MKHLLLSIYIIIPFLTARAQEIDCFINSFKTAYDSKRESLMLDDGVVYVPTIMNLSSEYDRWIKLTVTQRRDSLWSFLCVPELANDFAVDIRTGAFYIFPEGWLFKDRDASSVNRMIEISRFNCHPSKKALQEYLHNNSVEYVFTVCNFGYYGSNYWIIKNRQLIVLMFDEESNNLYPFEAEELFAENEPLFKTIGDW